MRRRPEPLLGNIGDRIRPTRYRRGGNRRLPARLRAAMALRFEWRDYGGRDHAAVCDGVSVTPSYFGTFRLSAISGRLPDSRDDADSMKVVVINEAMAKEMWPDGSPIGARLRFDFEEKQGWRTVIGVVPNMLHDDDGKIGPTVYTRTSRRSDNEHQRCVAKASAGSRCDSQALERPNRSGAIRLRSLASPASSRRRFRIIGSISRVCVSHLLRQPGPSACFAFPAASAARDECAGLGADKGGYSARYAGERRADHGRMSSAGRCR